jgi:uncharacterized alpha/beta hydrolase family protein
MKKITIQELQDVRSSTRLIFHIYIIGYSGACSSFINLIKKFVTSLPTPTREDENLELMCDQ